MGLWRTSFVAVAIALASLAGCTCEDNIRPTDVDGGACGIGSQACTTDDDCPERNVCHKDKTSGLSCCTRTSRTCANDSECCPGQICTADGKCVDRFDECTTDTDCGETPDRVCRDWTDPRLGTTKRCTYQPCGAGDVCPEGQSCFAHFCVVNPPCGGQCPSGSACVPQSAGGGRCHPYGQRCELAPKAGYLVVFTEPDNVFDSCTLSKEACEYAELPPLPALDLGRHPSGAVTGAGSLSVAQYDGHYGDLVVSDYDSTGNKTQTVWVDGVPANGTVLGGPSGPRGGISDPGPDVGKYTSTAAKADGTLYVSYYDQTNGDLRFAERGADGKWTSHRVDGAVADVGLYTSLAIDPTGKPAVAYFMRSGTEDPSVGCAQDPGAAKALITGVKLARARIEHPRAESDWAVEMVDCAARPPPPCYGCVGSGAKVCVLDATAPGGTVCMGSSAGCAPACSTGQVCTVGNKCMPQGSPTELADVPRGMGLFPSLAFKLGNPAIAYYDRTKGNLVAAQWSGTAWDRKTLDGEDANGDSGNVGSYPSLVVDGGNYLIAYHDLTRRGLRFYSSGSLVPVAQQRTPPATLVIDTGISDPLADGPAWVGANSSLVSTSAGVYVAYQNSTASDLRLAKKGPTGWSVVKEWTPGALGFFAHTLTLSDGLLVLHTRIHAKIAGGKAVSDNELKLEFVRPAP
ncbi:MAG TPA: dickkopf-related protein [Myxococcales bacterium]